MLHLILGIDDARYLGKTPYYLLYMHDGSQFGMASLALNGTDLRQTQGILPSAASHPTISLMPMTKLGRLYHVSDGDQRLAFSLMGRPHKSGPTNNCSFFVLMGLKSLRIGPPEAVPF